MVLALYSVPPRTNPSVSQDFLRAGVDDGTHTCTATDSDGGTGSASFVMRIITGMFVLVLALQKTVPSMWEKIRG